MSMSKHSLVSWVKNFIVGIAIIVILFSSASVDAAVPVAEVTYPAQKLELSLRESLMTGLMGSLLSASSFFMRKIAYDLAVAAASAGNGQTPLFITNPKEYAGQVAAGTIGSAVEELGSPLGLNLCRMPDINLQVFLQIGIRDIYGTGGPTPGCDWQNWQQFEDGIRDGWYNEFNRRYGSDARNAKFSDVKFNDFVSVRNSDFGVAMGAIATIDQMQISSRKIAEIEQQINNGIKDITSRISGLVVTPGVTVKEDLMLASVNKQWEFSNEQIAGMYAAEYPKLLPMAANVFLSTFASTLLNRLLDPNQGLIPPNPGDYSENFYSGGTGFSQRDAATRAFSFFLTPNIIESDAYDILAEFASCPQSPGLNNCVIDQGLADALRQAKTTGEPLTIRQAIERGYLRANWPLISWRRTADNTNVRDCYRQAYCYSNIQKLRKARILPLGFEIAALKALPDQSAVTLGEVVNRFNDCDPSGQASLEHPFCHLINPEWVLKVPNARCEIFAVGPQLVDANSALRRRECLDVSTCVVENSDGTCANVYGFCTKEKNVWRFGAESCPAQYSTCTTYQGNNGTASYLRRTLDTKYCNENTVGCQAYSLNLTDINADTWQSSAEVDLALKRQGIDNQVIHFNDAIQGETCSPDDEGCHAFYGGIRDVKSGNFINNSDSVYAIDFSEPIYIQRAPNYLGCYDTNRSTNSPEINWPVNEADLALVSQASACANYSRVCVESEVGCDRFARIDDPDAPAIPGIVGGNVCPLACVGYDAFREQPTLFAPTSSIQYFIPNSIASGGRCSLAQVGCSEFTNIDEAARGGEALEYYTNLQYCERPTGTNARTYYSWQGSVEQGYRLETHQLLQLSSSANQDIVRLGVQLASADPANFFAVGSPAYAKNTRTDLESFYRACNADVYNQAVLDQTTTGVFTANCRALYDENGVVYYRILSEVAEVSDACHPLRKTTGFMVTDPDLTRITNSDPSIVNGQNYCEQRGGYWADDLVDDQVNTPVCQRCANGGQYQNGACIYWTTSEPGGAYSCPAEANGCRKYLGTTGGNIRTNVIEKSFEPIARDANGLLTAGAGWSAVGGGTVRVVSEALKVGEHSLLLGAGGDTFRYELDPVAGEVLTTVRGWYELSFWARGDANALSVRFIQNGQVVGNFTVNPATNLNMPVRIGAEWQSYSLGQAEFVGNTTDPVYLEFAKEAASGPVYIDNVRLAHVPSEIIAVKDSWSTSEVCDSTPGDNVPGEMLGCKAYTSESTNRQVAALGFAKLCREEAVGCAPVIDTQNTLEGINPERARAYNVWCAGTPGPSTCTLVVGSGSEEESYTCPVLRGEEGCYVSGVIELPDGYTLPADSVTASTVIVPADTPMDGQLFLTVTDDVKCQSESMGCTRVGAEEKQFPTIDSTYTHSDVWIRNQPDKYIGAGGTRGTLCTNEAVSCSRFTSDDGVSYFKDPVLNGRATCTYRTGVQTVNGEINGWFLDGIGLCSNAGANGTQAYCRSDADCGAGNTCVANTINKQACYPEYQRLGENGIFYDLWSNDSVGNYQGLVGNCPATANSCTEFIDPVDTSSLYPAGQPYYALYNTDLRARSRECNGEVSVTEGCVLLNKTDDPDLQFDAAATYDLSERSSPPNGLVSPVSTNANDTNVILKVTRDRSCAEWLSCKSSFPVKQPDGTVRNVCYEYKSCTAAEPDSLDNGGRCVDRPIQNGAITRLTEQTYTGRGSGPNGVIGWRDVDYTGYSLFDQYQINDVRYISFDLGTYITNNETALSDDDEAFLVEAQRSSYIVYDRADASFDCTASNSDWRTCGAINPTAGGGRCYAGRCIYPLKGVFPSEQVISAQNIRNLFQYITGGTCKAYPEDDSPFPLSVVDYTRDADTREPKDRLDGTVFSRSRIDFLAPKRGFAEANICQNGNCSCEYIKAEYKSGLTDYWTFGTNQIPKGVCIGGDNDGHPCEVGGSASCNPNGVPDGGYCSPLVKRQTSIGLRGFCLEPDYSRPINGAANTLIGEQQEYACLTWLPIDVSASNVDLVNTYVSAGYNPEVDAVMRTQEGDAGIAGQAYCAAATQVSGKVNATDAQITADEVVNWSSLYTAANNYDMSASDLNRTFIDPPMVYRKMQTFAWLRWSNSVVLRVDRMGLTNTIYDSGNGNTGGSSARLVDQNFLLNTSPLILGNHLGRRSITVMHPPRVWGDTDAGSQQSRLDLIDQSYGENYAGDRYFSYSYAPYPDFQNDLPSRVFNFTNGLYNPFVSLVVRSRAEGVILEKDINRVYFVENQTPTERINEHTYIDFPLLSARVSAVDVRSESDILSYSAEDASRNTINITNGRATIWTYKLERRSTNHPDWPNNVAEDGLISWSEYQGSGSVFDDYKNRPQNRIDRRYVFVIASHFNRDDGTDTGSGPEFMRFPTSHGNFQPPADPSQDPFSSSVNCLEGEYWAAVGMDFNRDGEFLGYLTRVCNMVGFQGPLAVIATLNDQCTEFVQVYRDASTVSARESTNKAWTDRVWQPDDVPAPDQNGIQHPLFGEPLFRSTLNKPFGSLRLRGTDIDILNTNELLNYIFRYSEVPETMESPLPDGIPYTCVEPTWRGLSIIEDNTRVCTPANNATTGQNRTTALRAINQVFAEVFVTIRSAWNNGLQTLSSVGASSVAGDQNLGTVSGTLQPIRLDPPRIYSLNPATCYGVDLEQRQLGVCTAGEENNVTVNGKNATLTNYDGDIAGLADEDKNGIPGPDPIIKVRGHTAMLEFFAFADDNRMPLRRIMVDWGDGSQRTNESVYGLYKNHKPFCSDDDTLNITVGLCGSDANTLTSMTCRRDADCPTNDAGTRTLECYDPLSQDPNRVSSEYTKARFGNAARACTPEPFQFRHDYTCGAIDFEDLSGDGRPDREHAKTVAEVASADARAQLINQYGLTPESPVCVFQPRVQALDNWGWCNGQCVDSSRNLRDGCYNGAIESFGNDIPQCTPGRGSASNNPWTNYRGEIIVIPPG